MIYLCGMSLTQTGNIKHLVRCGFKTRRFHECINDGGEVVWVRSDQLNKTLNAGKYSYKVRGEKNRKHGESLTRFYKIWQGILARCTNKNDTSFKHYGGRGIKVCEKWKRYDIFRNDMLASYRDDLTLERTNVNMGYCKENCIWVPFSQQGRNRRNNRRITINGITKIADDWAKEYNIKPNTIITRITKYGWDPEKAVITPINKNCLKKNT